MEIEEPSFDWFGVRFGSSDAGDIYGWWFGVGNRCGVCLGAVIRVSAGFGVEFGVSTELGAESGSMLGLVLILG